MPSYSFSEFQRNRVRSTHGQSTLGFSLLEVLASLTIILVLLALAPAVSKNLLTSSGVTGGVEVVASSLELAKSEAALEPGGARLMLDADPGSPHYLKRIAIVQQIKPEDEEAYWLPKSNAIFLPKGAYFYLPYIGGGQQMTFQFSNAESPSNWIYFEYDRYGNLKQSEQEGRSQIVVINGVMTTDPPRTLHVPESKISSMKGVVLRRSGAVTFFPSVPTPPNQ